jgi:predicted AAA+ superfamily ATPase
VAAIVKNPLDLAIGSLFIKHTPFLDMIYRKYTSQLAHWLKKSRRKPLVLRGARQVGKSTLVREFAKSAGLEIVEVNLERHPVLDPVFRGLDVGRICREIEGLTGRRIDSAKTILFLDEIQAAPHALAALRYFHEEMPELPVVAAGSLLEFTLADREFSMPVGRVEYLHIGPLAFSEFLGAADAGLVPYWEAAGRFEEIPDTAHARLVERLREFLFVGGMPEAVREFLESGSLTGVREVQRSIVETYQDDFAKYARRVELVRLHGVFQRIPGNIGRKIKYVNLSREDLSRDTKACVDLLVRAQVCHRVEASHCSGLPLAAGENAKAFKLVSMDVGIVNFLCGGRWESLSQATAQSLVNEGALAEQFAGQHLAYLDPGKPALHYWLREGKAENAEVDYVVAADGKILPIEVKAGSAGSLKSLHQFCHEKKSPVALRLDLNKPSRFPVIFKAREGADRAEVRFQLWSLPLYAVEAVGGEVFHGAISRAGN